MLAVNEIHCINVLDGLRQLPDEGIDCVITSPPYWSLRDYCLNPIVWDDNPDCDHSWNKENFCHACGAWKGQLGLEPTFELYIKHLCDIFDEVKRVLKNSGTCWVNLGDTYSGSHQGYGKNAQERLSKKKTENLGSTEAYLQKYAHTINQKPPNCKTSVPTKSLCQIPARFAIEMCNRGWILRNRIIWHKPNCMPSSAKDRFTVDFEEILFFVKNRKYWFETQREPHKPASLVRVRRKWNGHREPMSSYQGMQIEKMCHPEGRNKRCVWTINTQPFSGAHFAVYPTRLIQTPIKAGCAPNGIVLDPFIGSGTTALVALQCKRRFIGFELNSKYVEIANRRLESAKEIKGLKPLEVQTWQDTQENAYAEKA
jgi:site-specific DNA-methyltransferase (adenine-specific)